MTYLPLIQQNEQMRRRIDKLDVELEKQREEAKQLQAQFDALRNDPKTVERLAREKLGYAKADETVIRYYTSQQLQAQFDALRNDPKTVERLAREKLGYAKADETVIRFEPSATNAPMH